MGFISKHINQTKQHLSILKMKNREPKIPAVRPSLSIKIKPISQLIHDSSNDANNELKKDINSDMKRNKSIQAR